MGVRLGDGAPMEGVSDRLRTRCIDSQRRAADEANLFMSASHDICSRPIGLLVWMGLGWKWDWRMVDLHPRQVLVTQKATRLADSLSSG